MERKIGTEISLSIKQLSYVIAEILCQHSDPRDYWCSWVAKLRTAARQAPLSITYSPECAQIHVHCVNDASQPYHSLSLPSPFAFNLSQHQGLFQWVNFASGGQIIGALASASVLPKGWFPLGLTGLIFLQSKGLSRVFSSTTIWKHQFFGAQSSLWSSSHIHTWLLKKSYLWLYGTLSTKQYLCSLIYCLDLL